MVSEPSFPTWELHKCYYFRDSIAKMFLVPVAISTHSSTLAWKIPWTEEPNRLYSMGSLRVRHDWVTSLSLFHFHALEKEMATPSSVLAWRIPGTGVPGGLPSMGPHKVGHHWSDLAAAVNIIKIQNGYPKIWENSSQHLPICICTYASKVMLQII